MDNYTRKIKVLRVIDGDTLEVEVDLGYRITTVQRVRLLGIDTPELHSSNMDERIAANSAKLFVQQWINIDPDGLYLTSTKSDSFDRWLGIVFRNGETSLNTTLIDLEYAVEYKR